MYDDDDDILTHSVVVKMYQIRSYIWDGAS